MGDKIRVMYSEEEVDKRIRELGEQISKRYEGKLLRITLCINANTIFRHSFTHKQPFFYCIIIEPVYTTSLWNFFLTNGEN